MHISLRFIHAARKRSVILIYIYKAEYTEPSTPRSDELTMSRNKRQRGMRADGSAVAPYRTTQCVFFYQWKPSTCRYTPWAPVPLCTPLCPLILLTAFRVRTPNASGPHTATPVSPSAPSSVSQRIVSMFGRPDRTVMRLLLAALFCRDGIGRMLSVGWRL